MPHAHSTINVAPISLSFVQGEQVQTPVSVILSTGTTHLNVFLNFLTALAVRVPPNVMVRSPYPVI